MSIVQMGDPVLRRTARQVVDYSPNLRRLVDRMFTAMHQADGVGLAAPQIGVGRQVFVYDCAGSRGVVVNPTLAVVDDDQVVEVEGCLSVRGRWAPTARARAVSVAGWDEHGQPVEVSASGLLARCFQHEVDHLAGVLYVDRNRAAA